MSHRIPIVGLSAALTVAVAFAPLRSGWAQSRQTSENSAQAPSLADMQQRGAELVFNQHKDDEALDQYERVEHELDTTGGATPRTLVDRKVRLVPNGAGATKVLLEQDGHAVTPQEYRRELQNWASVLQFMVNPNDERMKTATSKYMKKRQDRGRLVDAMLTAFTRKWVRREVLNGRDCDVIELQPDPNFHPRTIFEDALTHANAKIWVDHDEVQLVRAEAQITSDIYVGGGVLGKLYKGGTFVFEQSEVAPGIWLPARYQYDFSGRKFLFSFEEHESIQASHYRYIGNAKQALAVAESELSSQKPMAGDP